MLRIGTGSSLRSSPVPWCFILNLKDHCFLGDFKFIYSVEPTVYIKCNLDSTSYLSTLDYTPYEVKSQAESRKNQRKSSILNRGLCVQPVFPPVIPAIMSYSSSASNLRMTFFAFSSAIFIFCLKASSLDLA